MVINSEKTPNVCAKFSCLEYPNSKVQGFVDGAKPEKGVSNENQRPSVKVFHSPTLAQNHLQVCIPLHNNTRKQAKSEPTNIHQPMYINLCYEKIKEKTSSKISRPCCTLTFYNKFKSKQVFGGSFTLFLRILESNRLRIILFSIQIFQGGNKTR